MTEARRGGKLRAEGKTQQDIADALGVSEGMVRNDLNNPDVRNVADVPATRTDSKGREQPTRKPRKADETAVWA